MSSQSSYPTPQSDVAPLPESTAAKLERLSAVVPKTLNDGDFDFSSKEAQELLSYICPTCRVQLDTFAAESRAITFQEQVQRWKQRAEENPGVVFNTIGISSSVNEYKGLASVFISMEVTGTSEVTLHAMNELKWRKTDGIWQCVNIIGLRGSLGNAGG